MTVALDVLIEAVKAMLEQGNTTSNRLDVFDGAPKAVMDPDGRAHPYATVHTQPGNLHAETVCDTPDFLDLPLPITCAGGDPERARRAVTRVRDRLTGKPLMVAGVQVGVLVEDEFAQPAPIREDRDVSPSRWFTVLQYRLQTNRH